jgi:molybdopterin-guanine dinucleotide biosynthesis protein A
MQPTTRHPSPFAHHPSPMTDTDSTLTRMTLPMDCITAMVLSGGQGQRMGGVDKGLQPFQGRPMAQRALLRVGNSVGCVAINANRNLATYATFCERVWPDQDTDFSGPLAGFCAGLNQATTPYLLTLPCDCPFFPLDLVARLSSALIQSGAEVVMPRALESHADTQELRAQPVFALMSVTVLESLQSFMAQGGRKIDTWSQTRHHAWVDFDQPHDDPHAFSNINTLQDLAHWDALSEPSPHSTSMAAT